MQKIRRSMWILTFAMLSAVYAGGQVKLDNDKVISLVQSNLTEDLILGLIKGAEGQYTLDPEAVTTLKKWNVSNRVIQAMAEKMKPASSAPSQQSVPEPEREGLYYFFDETNKRLIPLSVEMGFNKGKAKLGGFGGAKTITEIPGEMSPTQVRTSAHTTFLVRIAGGMGIPYMPEDTLSQMTAPLHTFSRSKGKRERTAFDISYYGVGGKNTDKTQGDVKLEVTRAGGAILKLTTTTSLPPGEYGFSFPADARAISAHADAIYATFVVVP